MDGVFTTDEPTYLDLSQIEAVYALKSLAATNKYGTLGAGGVIVIRTKYGSFNAAEKKKQEDLAKLQNKNFYADDAVIFNGDGPETTAYLNELKAYGDGGQAYEYYKTVLSSGLTDYSDHLSIAQLFATFYSDSDTAKIIMQNVAAEHAKNPEIQKAVAYVYQALGFTREAVAQYKNIGRLRPNYAQSVRDMANAHLENNQFIQAWRLYMSYVLSDKEVTGEGIGQMIFTEMEYIYYNRSNQAEIREKFVPSSDDINDFRKDVRLVLEWNTSEAEFDMEFVNPGRRAYVFEHTLAANQELITDEKTKGYSSKEFYIEEIGKGEWLVNFTYKGNKKPQPTYFKLTVYYNWGKASQTQEIRVYKLNDQRRKLQLLRLTDEVLDTSR